MRFRSYDRGLDALAGEDGTPMHVKSANVPVYAMNMMSPGPGSDLGDPVTTLQMGDLVDAVGPSQNNPNGAPFTPVNVRGRDGVFWVRSTSIAENAPSVAAAPGARSPRAARGGAPPMPANKPSSLPWWGWGLIGLGAAMVGGVAIYEVKK